MTVRHYLVISDLHIGAGKTDDCDPTVEAGLIAFIDEVASADESVELVINGDFLDFAQAEPWNLPGIESESAMGDPLCHDETTSLRKLDRILRAHPLVFVALRALLDGHNRRLTILPGNHDVDLFWPSIRRRITDEICQGSSEREARLGFHLDQVYRPIGAPTVWIEHGHQYDPINSFFISVGEAPQPCWSEQRPPIICDKDSTPRLLECIGTRFLIQFMNHLDEEYPFVDNIKPFSRFLKLFGSSMTALHGGSARAAISLFAMTRYLASTILKRPSDLLSTSPRPGQDSKLGPQLIQLDEACRGAVFAVARAAGFEFDGMSAKLFLADENRSNRLLSFYLKHLDLLDQLEVRAASYLALACAFGIDDETDELRKTAHRIIKSGQATHVVMGHTHEVVDTRQYLNSGCWTRYWIADSGEPQPSWERMHKHYQHSLPIGCRFVHISPDPVTVTLKSFPGPLFS